MIPFDLSTLALFAGLQLEHKRGGTLAPDSHAVDSFVDRVTECLARYDAAKPRSDDDSWVAPVFAQDDELLGAMGEVTGNRGNTFLFIEDTMTTYLPDQVDQLYDEAFKLIIDVDCAARNDTAPEILKELAEKLAAFARGAREHTHENGWRRRFSAAA